MNDLQTITTMLTKADIDYTMGENSIGYFIEIMSGYIGFMTIMLFDTNGMLNSIHAHDV